MDNLSVHDANKGTLIGVITVNHPRQLANKITLACANYFSKPASIEVELPELNVLLKGRRVPVKVSNFKALIDLKETFIY